LGRRLREVRCWRALTLREVAGLAGLSCSFWGQVERGEKPVTSRTTLEAMAGALRVHPSELTGQPWASQDAAGADGMLGCWVLRPRWGVMSWALIRRSRCGPGRRSRPISTSC
jgi:transcriptional regulator with XRE-family HTH domain